MRLTVSFFGLALLATGCVQESLDLTGQWSGSMIVDGEHKNAPLRLELVHLEQAIEGSILWDDYRREIKAGSAEGPELRFESVQSAALRRPLETVVWQTYSQAGQGAAATSNSTTSGTSPETYI